MVLTEDIITQENDAAHRQELFDQQKEAESVILMAEINTLEQAISRVTPEKSALTTGLDQTSLDIYLKIKENKIRNCSYAGGRECL